MSCFCPLRKARKSTIPVHSGCGGVEYVSKRSLISAGGTILILEVGGIRGVKRPPMMCCDAPVDGDTLYVGDRWSVVSVRPVKEHFDALQPSRGGNGRGVTLPAIIVPRTGLRILLDEGHEFFCHC